MIDNDKTKVLLLVLAIICFAYSAAFAQGPGFDDDVDDTPIDGGVTLIVAAVAGYGYKKLADRKLEK